MNSRLHFKFALLAMAFFAINACKQVDKPIPEEPKDPTVEVRTSVFVDGNSASHSIPVTVTNPVAGQVLKATTSTEWILNLKATNEGITFDVADNLGDERSGSITVSYNSKEIATINVSQVAFAFEDFVIEIKDIKSTSAVVKFAPRGYKNNYFFEVFSKSAVDKYLALDTSKPGQMGWGDALYQSDLAYIKETVHTGMSFSDHLKGMTNMYKVTTSGEATEMKFSKLSLGTEYYAIVYGMDIEGKRTTPVAMRLFSTSSVVEASLSFDGNATNIGQNTATINITPNDLSATYYWTWADDATFKQVTLQEIQSQFIDDIVKAVAMSDYTMDDFLYKGKVSEKVEEDLSMGTLYQVVAWGMDREGNATSEAMEVFTFTTLENEITDNCTFDVQVTEVKAMDIQIKVTPSNPATKYYTAFISEARCKGMNDFQMYQRILNSENNSLANGSYGPGITWANHPDLHSGTCTIWGRQDLGWTFDPESNYRIYVFGVNEKGELTTAIKRVDAKTGTPAQSDNTFSVELVTNSWKYATFKITPSNPTDYYMPFLITTEDLATYRHEDGSLMEREVMDQIRDIYEDEISYYVYKGEREWTSNWTSDTDYSLLVFGYEGSNTTKMYEYKFHSPEIPFGKANCDLSYTYEIFRSEDLKALDANMWGRYDDGDCIMRVMIQTTGDPAHWYWGIWPPKENFASSGGIDHLVNLIIMPEVEGDNIVDKKGGLLRPWWYGADSNAKPGSGYIFKTEEGETMSYMPWSITAYAEDAEGRFGPLHYDLFIPIPEPKASVTGNREVGYTEAYQFWNVQSAPGVQEVIMKVSDVKAKGVSIKK